MKHIKFELAILYFDWCDGNRPLREYDNLTYFSMYFFVFVKIKNGRL